jgi:hypothetical protein
MNYLILACQLTPLLGLLLTDGIESNVTQQRIGNLDG